MSKNWLLRFGLRFPWLVLVVVLGVTVALTLQFPKVSFDNNPENMLAYDEPVRVIHREVKKRFDLYDFVVVGVVNNETPAGAWNPETLGRIDRLTRQLLSLDQNEQGRPTVEIDGERVIPELKPHGWWATILASAFRQDAERLFTEEGRPGLILPEMIAPGVVDTLRQLEQGALDIRYLMEEPPSTQEEADALFEEAWNNPLYRDTLLSGDRNAIGIYLPIVEKPFSANLARLVEVLTSDWPEEDQVLITGLPVAEDTFGQEMLVQMATSAPLAGLMIFVLLFIFFRRLSLIVAPMVLAVVTVLCTMGLLIGLGFDVHIMSSMIAIFLMPIAVADSVHILSEFFDTYPRFRNKQETLEYVMGHLFSPMLFTSLTTMAGFASLALTPIPPVRVFGLFVAFGVGLAWLLSVILVPAYIMLFVSSRTLDQLEHPEETEEGSGLFIRLVSAVGRIAVARRKAVVALLVVFAVLAGVGISRIEVNDNPVKWFTASHRIRVADRVLNDHFGGTYTAYLELVGPDVREATAKEVATQLGVVDLGAYLGDPDWEKELERFLQQDRERRSGWETLMDTVLYLEPEQVTPTVIQQEVAKQPEDLRLLYQAKVDVGESLRGADLQNAVLDQMEQALGPSLEEQVRQLTVTLEAPAFKRPEVLRWLADLQAHIAEGNRVGKSTSAVDALKKGHYELRREGDGPDQKRFYSVPDSVSGTAQVFLQLEGMKKKDSLFHLVSRDYRSTNLWLQLTSGDNRNMGAAKEAIEKWIAENPPPVDLEIEWAGLTYLNVVWQQRMVGGMLEALAGSFVVVLVMMIVLFRSWKFGLLSMVPLSLTIGMTYGIIGWVGKAYDMPVAVLSSLTLGLSVDFAIHFLQRARELTREHGSWSEAVPFMFREPARAISRNAIIIAMGFTPLLFAPLVPYKTVGFFLATIMFLSWMATLFILAALITMFPNWLFGKPDVIADRHES